MTDAPALVPAEIDADFIVGLAGPTGEIPYSARHSAIIKHALALGLLKPLSDEKEQPLPRPTDRST